MRPYLPFFLVSLVGIGALVAGTLLYRAKMPAVIQLSKEQSALAHSGTESAHIRGDSNAPVTIEEFGDLECPPCGALSEPINEIVKDSRGRVKVVFRQFPLSTHPHAYQAALATEAAALQGRFWEMQDLVFREQSTWSRQADARPLFEAFAGTLGLDLARFDQDRDGQQVKARVASDEKRGVALSVSTTPTIFVNGTEVPRDSLRPDRLRAFVDAAIKSASTH